MSTARPEVKGLLADMQPNHLEIRQEDWVKDLLDKLNPEEQDVVLDAFRDLKRFNRRKFSQT